MDLVQVVDSIGDIYPAISDSFTRTVSGGWGSTDTGQAWTVEGTAANASVSGGVGQHSITAIMADLHTVMSPTASDSEDVWSVTCPVVATGQSIIGMRTARRADVANAYRVEVSFGTGGALGLRLRKVVGGTATSLAFAATLTYTAGVKVWVRQQLIGSSLRARYWLDGTAEPGDWTLTTVDTDLASGGSGFTSTVNSGNTNTLPVVLVYDNFTMSSPTSVRLDLNDDVAWGLDYDRTDFSPPPLKEAYASSLLVDGETQTASAYENRRLKLGLDLNAADPDAVAAELAKLWRELNRDGNFLKWQPQGMSKPVFFRTIRSSQTSVVDYPGAGTLRSVDVIVAAEPFAYGLRETLPSVAVWNDPAEGVTLNANPFFEIDTATWTGSGGTIARSTAQAHEGVASLLLTPDGVTGTVAAQLDSTVPVTAGQQYRVSSWVRCAAARTVNVGLIWRDAGNLFLSTSFTAVAVAANTWTLIDGTHTAPAGAALAVFVGGNMTGTPLASHLLHIDEARVRQAGGVGGMCFDVTGVKGDVETPVVLHRPTANLGVETLLAVRRRGTPSGVPLLLQAEAMTQGTDTTVQANSTAFSGSGNNTSRVTFTTNAGYTARLSTTAWPATASVDARGQYRVFARLRKNGTTSTIRVRLRVAGLDLDEAIIASGVTATQMVDLGLVQIPTGADPVTDGPTGVPLPARGPSVEVWATRASGADTLDVDYLLWVPADDRLAIAHWPVTTAGRVVLDGVHDLTYGTSGSDVASGTPGYHVGGMPMLTPGVTNRIYVVNEVGAGLPEPAFPSRATWDGYYWPRFLTVRGAA